MITTINEFTEINEYKAIRVVARDGKHLKKLISLNIEKFGPKCTLNYIDVSGVTSMNSMFWKSNFNGDISGWDVSKVTDMEGMFQMSKFNGDIAQWDVSNVTDMEGMFQMSKFNGDISRWDVS